MSKAQVWTCDTADAERWRALKRFALPRYVVRAEPLGSNARAGEVIVTAGSWEELEQAIDGGQIQWMAERLAQKE